VCVLKSTSSRKKEPEGMNDVVVLSATIKGLPPSRQGKMRDIYETEDCLLIVAQALPVIRRSLNV
jgi:hypothetical protein